MALAALCWTLASCSDDTFNREYGEGMGYLRLQLGKVDVDLSSTTRAEAGSLPDDLIPQTYDDFMIDIKQGSTSVDDFPKKYSELSEEGIELKAGAYTVTAYYGENEPIQSTPYFSGSSTVEIYPGKSAEATINAVLANAMLVPAVSESLQKHYTAWSLKLMAGDSSVELANQDNTDGYLFAKADQLVNAVFEGINLLGKETSQEWTVISSVVAQTKYVIQCDPDLSIFSNIQLIATATHTYEEDVLTGTDVTLNIEDNGAPLELVDDWDIQLLYKGETIRTYSSRPQSNAIMAVTEGWSYVPQGSTLVAYIHLQTGETVELTSAVLEEIPQPEFTATVSGSTSYSVYKSSGADAANGTDGSSIFDINATATIAQEILGNYSDLLKVTYTIDDNEQSTKESTFGTPTEFNSLAWQKHTLTATITFDEVEITSSPVECDVTGLPYRATPPKSSDSDPLYGWEEGKGDTFKWENDYLQLGISGFSGEHTVYKTYYVPTDINVNISGKISAHNAPINTTCSILMGDETVMSVNSDGGAFDYKTSTKEETVPTTMRPSSNVVTLKNSYSVTRSWGRIYYINILYR